MRRSLKRVRWFSLPWLVILGAGGDGGAAHAAEAAGSAPAGQLFTFHETNILGTSLDLAVNAPTAALAQAAHEAVLADVENLRKSLSTYDADGALAKVNAGHDAVKVSKEVIEVLRLYEKWTTATKGAYSGRMGEMVDIWKKAEVEGGVPRRSDLMAVVNSIQKPLWKINEAAETVTRVGEAKINVDSLGKGFIISHAAAAARAKVPEVKGLMLNIGGDITALGSSSATADEPWVVSVADPAKPAQNAAALTSLHLSGQSVATSGDYERGYSVGGQKYSHILNPRTGYPVNYFGEMMPKSAGSVASATVVAPDNAAANALATTLNVLSVEDGFALVRSVPGAEAMIVLKNGEQLRSKGFERLERGFDEPVKGWQDGSTVEMTLQFPASRDRPYVAVWVEDPQGQYVTTLTEWGRNERYITSLFIWMREAGDSVDDINKSGVTRATRPAGAYKLSWDGKDQKGKVVPGGTYRIYVEFNTEHNGHSSSSVAISCNGTPSTATLKGTQHFDDMVLTYEGKK